MRDSALKTTARIAAWYAMFGLLWVVLHEKVIAIIVHDTDVMVDSPQYQDWISYITAGVVLSALIWWQLRARMKADQALIRRQEATRNLIREAELRLDDTKRLLELAEAAVSGFADWCLVDLVDEQMGVKRAVVVHANPARAAEADQLRQVNLNQPRHRSRLQSRMESSEPMLRQVVSPEGVAAAGADDGERRLLKSLRLRSAIVAPIRVGARPAGVISFLMADSGREFGVEDLVIARELSDRLGTALEHAQLLRQTLAAEQRAESEAKAARDRFRAQLELTQAVTDSMVEGIFAMDQHGRVTFVNLAAERLLGWTRAELLGHCVHVMPNCAPAEAECLHRECMIAQVLQNGRPQTVRDGQFRRKDGSLLEVSYTATPIRHDGVTTGVAISFYDVTARNAVELARRQAEDALREQQRLYQLIAENAQDLIMLVDREMVPVYYSPSIEILFGYTAEEMLAHGSQIYARYLHPEDVDRVRTSFAETLRGELPRGLRFRIRRQDGEYRWMDAVVKPILDQQGRASQMEIACRDVTERVEAERQRDEAEDALREQERQYRLLADNARDLVLLMSVRGAIQYASPSSVSMLGYTPTEMVQMEEQVIAKLVNADSHEAMKRVLTLVQKGVDPPLLVFQALHKDGTYRWLEAIVARVTGEEGGEPQLQVTIRDVTDRKRFEDQLAHQAFHDALTDLPNRSLLLNRLEHALARAQRRHEKVALLFLDLDDFKVVNDSLGHEAGDQLLVQFSSRLGGCVRAEDTIARMGGDEFAILLEAGGGSAEAVAVAERVTTALRPPFLVSGHEVFVAASAGIVLAHPDQYRDPGALLRDADAAMYRAKAKGKGRYELFDPGMNHEDLERLELETDLRHAVERNELRLHYQPIVSLVDGSVEGLEALVRWEHPQRGLLAPGQFIPLAEETGLIIPVGRWVLREACRQLKEWQQRYQLPTSFYVSVNINARQLQQFDVVERLQNHLEATGLAPEHLLLEITESVIMHETVRTLATLNAIKALGVRLAVDDFGTGYSSLSYVKRFPVDVLKIDRSFVSGLDSTDEAILRAIAAVSRTLHLDLVAEGVETAEQARRLLALGCRFGQGFHYFRPLAPKAVEPLLWALESSKVAD